MAMGRIKRFDSKKDFGFILPEQGSGEVFHSAIKSDGEFKSLTEGMKVSFDIADGKKGVPTLNVVVLPQ